MIKPTERHAAIRTIAMRHALRCGYGKLEARRFAADAIMRFEQDNGRSAFRALRSVINHMRPQQRKGWGTA